jgi:hypothetical protein
MKRHSIAITAAFAAVGLAGCSSMSTNPDEVGLVYNAGPLSNTQFDVCVQPGNKEWDGPSDKHIAYPAGQRTYRFDADKGADRGAFGINTKDPIELQVSGVVAFELNTDCEVLQQFHEKIGNKYTPAVDDSKTTGEWRDFLNDYLGVALKRALTDATQNTGWAPLYTDTKAKAQWEQSVLTDLPRYVKQAMGGDYLIIRSVTIQKPDLPDDLANAIRQTQVAVQENKAQTEKNAKINTELESIRELVKVLGPDGYNTYKAIEAGKITVMPIPQGSGVVLNGGPK